MGYAPEMIWDWFTERDYAILTPDRVAHDSDPLGRDAFLDGHIYPFRTLDYFAIPLEKRESARNRARKTLNVSTG